MVSKKSQQSSDTFERSTAKRDSAMRSMSPMASVRSTSRSSRHPPAARTSTSVRTPLRPSASTLRAASLSLDERIATAAVVGNSRTTAAKRGESLAAQRVAESSIAVARCSRMSRTASSSDSRWIAR
jgi:hypothetical protein